MKFTNILGIVLLILALAVGTLCVDSRAATNPDVAVIRTRRPTATRRPTRTPIFTRTPISTKTPTPWPTATFTVTPLPTFTETPIPTATMIPTQAGDIIEMPISAVPVNGIPEAERLALSERLLDDDVILIRSTSAELFLDFPYQDQRSMLFTINEDGYPDNVHAAISSLLELADEYEVTTLSYNLEWPEHSLAEKVARLSAVRAELDEQGNTLPLVFGPIYYDFMVNYASFAPYIEGYAVQLQRAEIGMEATLAAQAIVKAESVLDDPIMYFQISCQTTGFPRTAEQVIAAVQQMNEIEGIDYVDLYFNEWWLASTVLDVLRP